MNKIERPTGMPKKEWIQLLNDERWEPPPFFVVNPFNEKQIFRSNYNYLEYLNPLAVNKFFGTSKKNPPKFDLRERKKNLILMQDALVDLLDTVFAFPASIEFFSIFSGFLMDEMITREGIRHPKTNVGPQSKWFLTVMSALLLKKYFGGKIVDRKYSKKLGGNKEFSNLTVELAAVPYDIFIFNKVHDFKALKFDDLAFDNGLSYSRNFNNWIYTLFYCLWRYTNEGKTFNEPFHMDTLDYISERIY